MTEIEDLIKQLQELRIEEDKLIAKIEALANSNKEPAAHQNVSEKTTTRNENDSGLSRHTNTRLHNNPSHSHEKHTFYPGDLVRIKNRITTTTLLNRKTSEGDRRAVVTRLGTNKKGVVDKVYITTENGLSTYRLPKNLAHRQE